MKRFNRSFHALLVAMGLLVLSLPALAHARAMGVEIWTDRGDDAVYEPGDPMTLKVRTSDDAYLLVYEIDSEGVVRVLYPSRRGAGLVEGRRTLRIPAENSRYELAVGDKTGQGYLVAIASREPFRELPWFLRPYDPQAEELGYDRETRDEEGFDEDGKVVGDPYVAMERIRRVVLGRANDEDLFSSSYTSYYVGHEVRYPRYICNDCHRPGRWTWWNDFDPYYTNCSVFDFRVNWNWTWGPHLWTSYVPYYYYVVRVDCPPRYHGWYNDRSRWSSWDGWGRWNNLWGGNLTRHKPPTPPPGYVGPPKVRGNDRNPTYLPPGYIANRVGKRGGPGEPLPIGRNRPGSDEDRRPSDRGTGRDTERMPAKQWDAPRREPASRPNTEEGGKSGGGRGYEKPAERPQPRYEPPTREPDSSPPKQQPSNDPPRKERRDDPPPRQDPPRQQEPPRKEPPRQEPPRKDPPSQQRDSGGGRHKGGGNW